MSLRRVCQRSIQSRSNLSTDKMSFYSFRKNLIQRLCNEDSPTSATKATTTPIYPTTGGKQATTTRTTTAE
jgi:hypothetical protein